MWKFFTRRGLCSFGSSFSKELLSLIQKRHCPNLSSPPVNSNKPRCRVIAHSVSPHEAGIPDPPPHPQVAFGAGVQTRQTLEATGPMTAHLQTVQKSVGGTRRVQTEAGTAALVTVRNLPVNADNFHTVTRKSLCSF